MDRERSDWMGIALLWALGLTASAQFAKVALALEALALRYPAAPVTNAVSALSLTGIALGVSAGVIVARLGVRRALAASVLLGPTASVIQATLPPFSILLLLRVIEGAAHLGLVVAVPTAMAMAARPADVPVAMGLWGTFFGVGFAVWALVAQVLPEPQSAFILHGVAMLALGWPVLRRLPPEPAVAPPREGFLARHLAVYRAPRILAPALGFFWHTALFLGLLTFLPGVVGSWTAALLPLSALAGTFAAGLAARTVAPSRVMLAGFVLSLAGLAALLAVPPGWQGAVSLALMAVIGIVPGAAFADVPALNASAADRARANGVIAQLGNVGTALSVPAFAAAVVAGLPGLAALAAGLSAAGIGAVWFIHRKIR